MHGRKLLLCGGLIDLYKLKSFLSPFCVSRGSVEDNGATPNGQCG